MRLKRVIFQIVGGVGSVVKVPKGVIVEVREYDEGKELGLGAPGVKADKNGSPYYWYEEIAE